MHIYLIQYFNKISPGGKSIDLVEKVIKQQLNLTDFLNSFVLDMQITLLHFKNDKTYCHCTNKSQNFSNYKNLMLKTEKQEMHYLNYHNALWDCFRFHIAQISNMLPNQAVLPVWVISPDC